MITAGIFATDARIYPGSPVKLRKRIAMIAARGERKSCQIYIENTGVDTVCRLSAGETDGIGVRVRRVGSVPMLRHNTRTPPADRAGNNPGVVPDVLYDESEEYVSAPGTGLFWITLQIDPASSPRVHTIQLKLDAGEQRVEFLVDIQVSQVALKPRTGLPVTHWFYSDALLDWYNLDGFNDEYWRIVKAYMENLLSHGNDVLYVPLFSPTTDGDRRPAQLLEVGDTFGWDSVAKYVELAKSVGFQRFEWPHLFSQWGAGQAIRVYRRHGESEELLWTDGTGATSHTYREFLSRFLPEFKQFLERQGILEGSYFHVSDEPHGEEHRENYTSSRDMLRSLAPWMKTMDAVSEIEYGRDNLTDIPIPQLGSAMDYVESKIHCFTYFCCNPRQRYINRVLDTPLHKIRMLGWALYRHKEYIHGFLHWGYNYWYRSQTRTLIDPFLVTDAGAWPGWAYGDPFVVYPGKNGPLDSIRWEIFAEGLADYQLLETLDVDPDFLGSVRNFADFPRNPVWPSAMKAKLLLASG